MSDTLSVNAAHLTRGGSNSMKLIRTVLLIVFAIVMALPFGMGKAEYAKKEGKACSFCHPPGKFKELTDAGKYYKDHNHSLEGYKAPSGS
jgi:hypothetical protein